MNMHKRQRTDNDNSRSTKYRPYKNISGVIDAFVRTYITDQWIDTYYKDLENMDSSDMYRHYYSINRFIPYIDRDYIKYVTGKLDIPNKFDDCIILFEYTNWDLSLNLSLEEVHKVAMSMIADKANIIHIRTQHIIKRIEKAIYRNTYVKNP